MQPRQEVRAQLKLDLLEQNSSSMRCYEVVSGVSWRDCHRLITVVMFSFLTVEGRIEWAIFRDRVNQGSNFTSALRSTKLTSEFGNILS